MADRTSPSNVIELRRKPDTRPRLQGDEEELFRELQPMLLRRTAHRVFAPHAVIEEACSLAWLQFLRSQPRPEEPAAWLTVVARQEGWRLARQETASTVRSRSGLPPRTGADLAEQVADPRDIELALETKKALHLLAGLKASQRTVISLRVAGYSYQEIEAITGKTYTWVNRHASEGRALLRSRREAA